MSVAAFLILSDLGATGEYYIKTGKDVTTTVPRSVILDIEEFRKTGYLIHAIVLIREKTGSSLLDAKVCYDNRTYGKKV